MPSRSARPSALRRKTRTRGHIIADLSANYVERLALLVGHSVERVHHDYGIDLIVSTYTSGRVDAGEISVQLKATDSLKVVAKGAAISVRVETRDLDLWQENIYPVILIVYDAKNDDAYWLYVQRYLATAPASLHTKLSTQSTLAMRVPQKNALTTQSLADFATFKAKILGQTNGKVRHDL